MAEQQADEKSEEPTEQRLRRAREEGQVAESQEVPAAAVMLALTLMLVGGGWMLLTFFIRQMRQGLRVDPGTGWSESHFEHVLARVGFDTLWELLPYFLVLTFAATFGSMITSGINFAPKAVKLNWEKVSVPNNAKNLMSIKSVVRATLSLAKMAAISAVVWYHLSHAPSLREMAYGTPMSLMTRTAALVGVAAAQVLALLIVIAIIDLLYQRYNHRKQLRMTKKEVKDEQRDQEMAPEVKKHMRQTQQEMNQKRHLQDVPEADVVVTNPDHVAVALKYDPAAMSAPQVLAKGADNLCYRIKEIARENDVPLVENAPVARALYQAVEPGDEIPESLFVSVAEILAMIYRARRRGRRAGA